MIKTLKNLLKQDKERYTVPRKVQDMLPIQRIWKDGIFKVGNRFSKTYKFTDKITLWQAVKIKNLCFFPIQSS